MASFNMVGLGELEKAFIGHARLLDDAAPEMLAAGTEVLVERMKQHIDEIHESSKRLVVTGDMRDSIKAGPVREDQDGHYQEVWPQGTDRNGVSNAKKGFIQEYGTSRSDARKEKNPKKYGKRKRNIGATHWMSDAADGAAPDVVETMREVWNDHLERNE